MSSHELIGWKHATSGHKGCWQDCWLGRVAYRERAYRCVFGIWSGEEEQWDHLGVWFGWWHFDVSVLEVGDGVCEVLATNGDTHLGGDDFDKVIVDWLAEDFQKTEAGKW